MKLIKTTTTTKINNQPRLLLVNTTWTDQHRRQAFSQFSEFSYFLTEKPWRREGQVFPWKNEERPGDEMVERAMMTSSWRHGEETTAMPVFENGALLRLVKRRLKVRCRKHTEWVSSDAIVICAIIFSPFFPLFFCLVSLSNLASVLTVEHVESCDRHMTYP